MTATENPTPEDATNVVDWTPDRCPFTWTPPPPHNSRQLRCTQRAEVEHDHRWDSGDQHQWVAQTLRRVDAALVERGQA